MKNGYILYFLIAYFILTGSAHAANTLPVDANQGKMTSSIRDTFAMYDSLVAENRIKNNSLSLLYAKKALKKAIQSGKKKDLVIAYIINGSSFNTNNKDSSFWYFDHAKNIVDEAGTLKQKARIIYNLATLYDDAFNFQQGMTYLDSTIQLAESAKEYEMLANAYNALGGLQEILHDSATAKQMFDTSLQIAKAHSLFKQMGTALGNLADFQDNNSKAISFLTDAINDLNKAKGTEEEIGNALINIGNKNVKPDSAIHYYLKAINTAKNGNLPLIEIGAYNSMAYSYLDLKDITRAESCITHAIDIALLIKNNDWLSTLYDSYCDILISKGEYKDAVNWLKKAITAREDADRQKASDQVRLLGTQLDVKNKELTIQNTETELLVQKNRLQQTRLWLIVSVLFIIGAVFVLLSIMQRNRMKFQHEQIPSARRLIEMEESEKGRTARELHDITGQLIMGITGAVEKLDLPDDRNKAEIQGKIKDLGRSIRTISHRMNKAMLEHFTFKELITGQCEDIQKLTGMRVQLDMPEGNYDLDEEMVLHSYRIMQELLTNASKHVADSTIRISFVNRNDHLIMSYSDNGKGFDTKELKNRGMGIMNIFERAKLLGGKAKLTSSPGNGTKWEIFIPLRIKKKSQLNKVNA